MANKTRPIPQAYEKILFLLDDGVPKNYVDPKTDAEHRELMARAGTRIPDLSDEEGKKKAAQACWDGLGKYTTIQNILSDSEAQLVMLLVHKRVLKLSFADFVTGATSEADAKDKIIRKIVDGLNAVPRSGPSRPRQRTKHLRRDRTH